MQAMSRTRWVTSGSCAAGASERRRRSDVEHRESFLLAAITTPTVAGGPSGCLIAKMRAARLRLGPVTGEHIDRISIEMKVAYAAWLRRCAQSGDIELSESVETTASYIDAQLTMALNRIGAGEDPTTVRTHTRMAFAAIIGPSTIG